MNCIIDTRVLLWWLSDDPLLPGNLRKIIENTDNICFISAVSIWEISIKSSIVKLEIPGKYLDILRDQGFHDLPIYLEHADNVAKLPFHHRDPFDRLIIAQAMVEELTILTTDEVIPLYKVKTLTK
ncbi:MAG: type II toxin-antitoxin system VapC family toxin [Spirochaetaceae bacterium]|nr:MAG: type II toxin-antitoxin system VapC family toxin [Spirochaetaceae bacterium]